MKKFLSMLLILCLFLGALPAQALAYVADNIQRADTVCLLYASPSPRDLG